MKLWILWLGLVCLMPLRANSENTVYTCSMHPSVRMPDDSQPCPVCHMDLIPLEEHAQDPRTLKLSPALKSHIQTTTPAARTLVQKIRLSAAVAPKTTASFTYALYSSGRVENLQISHPSQSIETGDRLYELYSPALITAQQDYLQASQLEGSFGQKQLQDSTTKLLWLGFAPSLFAKLERKQAPLQLVPVFARHSGQVTRVQLQSGEYGQEGQPVFELLINSAVEIQARLNEAEFSRLRGPRKASFERLGDSKKIPLRFLYDQDHRLDSEFLKVYSPDQYLPVATRGILHLNLEKEVGVSLPNSALLFGGTEDYVFTLQQDQIQFRRVEAGFRGEEFTEILDGISADSTVLSGGAFAVDSQFQIRSQPSMMQHMSSSPLATPTRQQPEISPEESQLAVEVLDDYLFLWESLSKDDKASSQMALSSFKDKLMSSSRAPKVDSWPSRSSSLEEMRRIFQSISQWLISIAEAGQLESKNLFKAHCPMAFDWEGADWLQRGEDILNPYFGHSMQKCGSLKRSYP